MNTATKITLVALALAMCSCSRPDADRTTFVSSRNGQPAEVTPPVMSLSAPAAPPQRGPIPPNANAAAPGTDASQAFAANPPDTTKPPPPKGGSPEEQETNVAAEEAAAKAPDTASADAAKRAVKEQASEGNSTQPRQSTSP
jgi:hypothetical protein